MRRHCKLDGRMARRSPSPSRSASPTRTCVGCGVRAAKSDLLRVVAVGDDLIPDAAARLPGRGAYLHPVQGCLGRAQRRKVLVRALRVPGTIRGEGLAEYLAAQPLA